MEQRFSLIHVLILCSALSKLSFGIESHNRYQHDCFIHCLSKLREVSYDPNSVECACGDCITPLIERRTMDTANEYTSRCEFDINNKKSKKQQLKDIVDNNVEDINKEVLDDRYIDANSIQESKNVPQDDTANNENIGQVITPRVAPTTPPTTQEPETHRPPVHIVAKDKSTNTGLETNSIAFLLIVIGCSTAGVVGLILAGVCWYKIHKRAKESSEVDYPAYGVTGPNKNRSVSPGDRKLAESAQMYHYQHQKQQMIALERANSEKNEGDTDGDTDEDNEEDHVTVYECPGLAPTGEMEVRNPLFNEDLTPTPGEKSVKN